MKPPAGDAPSSNLQTLYDGLAVTLGLVFLGRVAYIVFVRPPGTNPFGSLVIMLLLGTALVAWIVFRIRDRRQRAAARRAREDRQQK